MTRSSSFSVIGCKFDDFLFSRIGEDKNDTPLTVLSALARSGIDPWQEAAELAGLPRETAIKRLASSIAALPDRPLAHFEHGTTAARLIALLPRQTNSDAPLGETQANVNDATKFRAGLYMYIVLIAFMLVSQWMVTSRQTSAPADSTDPLEAPAGRHATPNETSGPPPANSP
jgi:hypothetical protein